MTKDEEQNIAVGPVLGVVLVIGIIFFVIIGLQSSKTENNTMVDTYQDTPEPTPTKLEDCVAKAEDKYNDVLQLNSVPAPEEGYPDARKWNNSSISEKAESDRRADIELCIKLYK